MRAVPQPNDAARGHELARARAGLRPRIVERQPVARESVSVGVCNRRGAPPEALADAVGLRHLPMRYVEGRWGQGGAHPLNDSTCSLSVRATSLTCDRGERT
eukprot:3538169-Pleurochrysis_carterae.AAC.1